MAYTLVTFPEQRLYFTRYSNGVSLDDVRDNSNRLVSLLDEAPQRIFVVADSRSVTSYPNKLQELVRMMAKFLQHENTFYFILITDNRIVDFLASVITQVSGTKLATFHSVREALEFVSRHVPEEMRADILALDLESVK